MSITSLSITNWPYNSSRGYSLILRILLGRTAGDWLEHFFGEKDMPCFNLLTSLSSFAKHILNAFSDTACYIRTTPSSTPVARYLPLGLNFIVQIIPLCALISCPIYTALNSFKLFLLILTLIRRVLYLPTLLHFDLTFPENTTRHLKE
jgi:hypothetical protein